MHAFTAALYQHLHRDPELNSAVDGQIISSREAPADARLPYILIRAPAAETPFDTLKRRGWTITQDIAIFAEQKAGASSRPLDLIAERVRRLLHLAHIPIEGWHLASLTVAGPTDSPQEESGYAGRIVSVTATVQED